MAMNQQSYPCFAMVALVLLNAIITVMDRDLASS
jgi:hypothetical protein